MSNNRKNFLEIMKRWSEDFRRVAQILMNALNFYWSTNQNGFLTITIKFSTIYSWSEIQIQFCLMHLRTQTSRWQIFNFLIPRHLQIQMVQRFWTRRIKSKALLRKKKQFYVIWGWVKSSFSVLLMSYSFPVVVLWFGRTSASHFFFPSWTTCIVIDTKRNISWDRTSTSLPPRRTNTHFRTITRVTAFIYSSRYPKGPKRQ